MQFLHLTTSSFSVIKLALSVAEVFKKHVPARGRRSRHRRVKCREIRYDRAGRKNVLGT